MSMRMASFLTGFGNGAIKASEKEYERARQEKQDAWLTEQQDRQRADWKDADTLKSDLKNAAATVTPEQGANGMIKPTEMDNRDVGQADTASLPNGGLMQGQFKVGNKSFADKAAADAAAADMNSRDAVAQRTADAYRKNGKALEAINMENSVMDSKLKKLGLTEAEVKHADNEFNRKLMAGLQEHPDWTVGAAKMLTETQVGGLNGISVTPKVSADGKTVQFVGKDADGKEHMLKSFKNSAAGMADFLQSATKASAETKIGYLVEQAKAEQAQANADRTFNQQNDHFKVTSDLQRAQINASAGAHAASNRVAMGQLALLQAEDARKQKLFDADAKIPQVVKTAYSALQEQAKAMDSVLYKAQVDGTAQAGAGQDEFMAKRAMLSIQMNKLLSPYMPTEATKPSATDPLGLGKQTSAAPATGTLTSEDYMQQVAARKAAGK